LVDKIDLYDGRITPLPPDFNLPELQQTDQYGDNIAATIEVDAGEDYLEIVEHMTGRLLLLHLAASDSTRAPK
jgi:hypothetical protein